MKLGLGGRVLLEGVDFEVPANDEAESIASADDDIIAAISTVSGASLVC